MKKREIAEVLGNKDILWSTFPFNARRIKEWVLDNPQDVKATIRYLINENITVEKRFDAIASNQGEYHIPGIGSFLTSMLFSSLNDESYTIVNERNLEGLKKLGLIDV